jgi:radical SAM protein with 4Fe4S-binding SPASM domain
MLQFSSDKKPVVVWNATQRCNLKCRHCYSLSGNAPAENEMNTAEAIRFIDGLAYFGVPVLLFSGGEPLMRPDLFELIAYTRSKNIRAVISTNGTLITEDICAKLAQAGLSYVGVSIDGLAEKHDRFRGVPGAFVRAVQGIRICKRSGVKVGLRLTITKDTVDDIPQIFNFIELEQIPRICFYHLVYTGRAADLVDYDLDSSRTRELVDFIIDRTADLHRHMPQIEVLTVDNHTDGVYLYLRMKREKSPRADAVLQLLRMNGGNNSGIGIGCVSWDGTVYPDQFWRHHALGNVRERAFGDIWTNPNEVLLKQLRNRTELLLGRCKRCVWKSICNGNFRVRAEARYGGIWHEDPACYLTEEEISGII